MKVSELKQIIEDLMLRYGDLDIIFKDEYSNNRYEIKDVMLSFSKGEDKYIITNHYYEQKNCILNYNRTLKNKYYAHITVISHIYIIRNKIIYILMEVTV